MFRRKTRCQAKDPATCPYHGYRTTLEKQVKQAKKEGFKSYENALNELHNFDKKTEITHARMTSSRWKDRTGLAFDPETPSDVLHTLADDPTPTVREAVLCNDNVSDKTVNKLRKDPDSYVREAANKRAEGIHVKGFSTELNSSSRSIARMILADTYQLSPEKYDYDKIIPELFISGRNEYGATVELKPEYRSSLYDTAQKYRK